MQGGLSASLASRDPNSNRKPQAAPPPSSIQIPINPPQMQARAGAQEAETSQQAKQLVEWMAANNVSTDALKTILLSKSPTDNNQSKKKRVHDAEGGISFQSLMTAQAAVDAGSGSLPKTLTALQGQKAGQDPIPNLPSLPQETMGQAMNSLAPQRQPQRVSRRSEGFELDELGSNDGDDGEEEDEDEDEKEGGGHRGSSYQGAKLTYEDLQGQFGKGIKDAAKDLGICTTTLKRACRRHGITRWPRRQIAKLNKALAQIGYAGDASGRLLESAVKGSKAGMSIKQASQPKPQFSTAVKQEDSFMPLSMKIPAANPSNVLPSDVLHSLLMIQAQRNQPGPAIAHPQSQPDLSHLLNQFSSSGGAGYSGQQQQYQQQQNQQQMWGHSAAPPNPPQMNYLPQHQSSEGRPQASADMLNLALELFSSGNGGEEEPDISLGSLLVNEEDMKGIGAFAGHATLF